MWRRSSTHEVRGAFAPAPSDDPAEVELAGSLDHPFPLEGISEKLRVRKAPGRDLILNKYLKAATPLLLSLWTLLFKTSFTIGALVSRKASMWGPFTARYSQAYRPAYRQKHHLDRTTRFRGR